MEMENNDRIKYDLENEEEFFNDKIAVEEIDEDLSGYDEDDDVDDDDRSEEDVIEQE